jgi:hypothetical protein
VGAAKNMVVPKEGIPKAAADLRGPDGVLVRSTKGAYWATHLLHRLRPTFDVEAQVVSVSSTNTGAQTCSCAVRGEDGNLTNVGKTFPQSHKKAKPGEVIRVRITGVSKKFGRKAGPPCYTWIEPMVAKGMRIPGNRMDTTARMEHIWKKTKGA